MARILLVEDEPNIGGIIVFKLRREGHDVHWLEAGRTVLSEAGLMEADVVLLDTSLPDVDPFELLTALSPRPVIMLTEFRDSSTADRARQAGVAAVVEKPFKPTVLARLVAQLAPVS